MEKSMRKKGIFEAKDLVCYIKEKYSEFTNNTKEITPIKLQKSLYFCFAYWAGFVGKGKIDGSIDENTNSFLFADKFQAWAYGPVVPDVYFDENNKLLFKLKSQIEKSSNKVKQILANDDILKETLDSILEDVFEISDFKLVSLSHMDNSWQNHFNESDLKHHEEIPHLEIINEYTAKKFN